MGMRKEKLDNVYPINNRDRKFYKKQMRKWFRRMGKMFLDDAPKKYKFGGWYW